MKHLKILLLIVAASLLLVACGSGGGDGDSTASVVGTWELTNVVEAGVSQDVPAGMFGLVVGDSTYEVLDNDCDEKGTYTVDGSIMSIEVTYVNPGAVDCEVPGDTGTLPYSVNSTTLVLNDRGDILTFTRK